MELTIEQALQQGITAHKEGKLQEAERLYRDILQSQPLHPDANHNLGVLEVSANKADAALPLFKTALEANPKIEQFWLSYIDALIKEKQFENAKQFLEQARKLGLVGDKVDALEAESSVSAVNINYIESSSDELAPAIKFREAGKFQEARKWLQKFIESQTNHAEAYKNLGNTLLALGRLEEAQVSYKEAISVQPNYAEAHNNLGITLKELGRLDEAEASYTQAIALKPDFAEAHNNLGNTLKELGRLDEAEANYRQAIALKPENIKAHNQLLTCLFLQDKKSVFFDELDYLINQDKANATIGSLASRSALKYGLEKPNLFCTKPLNYVLHNDLNTRYDFEKIFIEKAKSILKENQISNRKQTLLVNGNQTSGNIFDIENDGTNEIQNIIRSEVERYQTKFKESEEGLIKKMPVEYTLDGWLISMKSGGNLKPHIHTEGWLSGSIYINVPRKLKVDNGNLVVALGEDNDATDTRKNEKKTINVVTGSMVLFPASLMHYTIPFESAEERIVLAFDVKKND